MGKLDGKVALVTGAARGQGRSHAVKLAQEGADIIALDICAPIRNVKYPAATKDDLAETVAGVKNAGRRIISDVVDTRDRLALQDLAARGVAELGRLDVIVANAGICIMDSWESITPEVWQDTIDINLTGTWNTVMAGVPHIINGHNGGSVILTSSAAGLKGLPFLTPYVASKHGITGLTRAFAQELAEHGIRVNSVHPTGVDTPMGTGMGDIHKLLEKHPKLGGMFINSLPVEITEPIDISNAVLFLASDESRYVTALAMTVDAGNTQY
jgi:SDR family mycofactocin-dependent oxidoreductase